MKLPQLRKQRTSKNYHGITINDDYAWVDQPNILEVLKDSSKLLPEVKKYVEENNNITEQYFADSKNFLFHATNIIFTSRKMFNALGKPSFEAASHLYARMKIWRNQGYHS